MTCAPRLLPHRPPTRPNKLYQQAQEILLNDLPAIPLYYSNANGVARIRSEELRHELAERSGV